MRTVRRIYFYLVALISLEVVIWGVIYLVRTFFHRGALENTGSQIATGISLVAVGLPIFLLHWLVMQRGALRDNEERASRLRAIFLYAALLATSIPMAQSLLALLNRPLMTVFAIEPGRALVGSSQIAADNLVALAANLIAWLYFWRITQQDWAARLPGDDLRDVRRLYRSIWMLYSLIMTIMGVQSILRYILFLPGGVGNAALQGLANGLALAAVGTPLWVYTWLRLQNSLDEPGERGSTLRLVVLFLLSLSGAVTVLVIAGMFINYSLRWLLLVDNLSTTQFLNQHGGLLSVAIPLGTVWAYFGRHYNLHIAAEADPQRRAGMRRLYVYILSLLGLIATYFGLQMLLSYLIDTGMTSMLDRTTLGAQLSSGLGALLVGLPVWLSNWPRLQRQAALRGDEGDHARRSVLRKGYLYLILFATVVGSMGAAGIWFYHMLNAALQGSGSNFWLDFTHKLQTLVLLLAWLGYHFYVLRQDGRMAQAALTEKHTHFPVLVLQVGESAFAAEVQEALQRQMPRLPVTTLRLDQNGLENSLNTARAVILPAGLAARPPEALRLWLNDFPGQRIAVPLPEESWVWLGTAQRSLRQMAQEAAQAVRQMAEGQPVRAAAPTNAWVIIAYVLGGLFGLQLVALLVGIAVSALFN